MANDPAQVFLTVLNQILARFKSTCPLRSEHHRLEEGFLQAWAASR